MKGHREEEQRQVYEELQSMSRDELLRYAARYAIVISDLTRQMDEMMKIVSDVIVLLRPQVKR